MLGQCIVSGCNHLGRIRRDMCDLHYGRWWRTGSTDKAPRPVKGKDPERLWAAQAKYREKNREAMRIRARESARRLRADPVQLAIHRERQRAYRLENKVRMQGMTYGLVEAETLRLMASANGRCQLCGDLPGNAHGLVIDHDHATNHIRGVICQRCNIGLGMLMNVEGLQKAIAYLRAPPAAALIQGPRHIRPSIRAVQKPG